MKEEEGGQRQGKERKSMDSGNCDDKNKTRHYNRMMGGVCLAALDWEISDGLSEEATFALKLE